MRRRAHVVDPRGSARLRVLASTVALAADFAALKGSEETVSTAGSWRGRVTVDLSDAHAFGR
jgi:hypothetical protein